MKKFVKLLAAAVALILIASCEKPVSPQTPSEPDTPVTPAPEQAPFKLKVYDISSVTATVEVEPEDKESPYYMDVINESDFLQAQQYGFDDYMTWFIGSLMEQTGKGRADVIKMISSYGNDGFILTSLKPETTYYAFAVGIDDDGMTTTEVVYEKFETPQKEESANTFDLEVTDVTATTAMIAADVSNEDTYILTIEPANIIEGLSDAELTDYVIQNNIAWGGLEGITYSGDQEFEWAGKSGWDYVVVAFGYENGAVTTDVARKDFQMGEGGNPASCSFSFTQDFNGFEMSLGISPSDNSVVYICNYVEMSDLQALMAVHGSLDGAFGECLEMLVEDMIEDLGTKERVIDLITAMGAQEFTTKYEHGTEYIQWAVPVDQDGNPVASFSFSSPFTTPEEKISDASLTVKSYKYYDGTELANLYPDLSVAKGYAVVDLEVEPSASAVQWWSYIALEDLTDRSREVIIKNVLSAPTEQGLTRQLIVAYWGVNTIMGVAQDADGAYGELLLEVVNLNKENAAPASEFVF